MEPSGVASLVERGESQVLSPLAAVLPNPMAFATHNYLGEFREGSEFH